MSMDVIQEFHGCLIQHGGHSRRIYVMKWAEENVRGALAALDDLARNRGYTKIFVKAPESSSRFFGEQGYRQEAVIPDYFALQQSCVFWGKYFSRERAVVKNGAELQGVLALARAQKSASLSLLQGREIKKAQGIHAEALARIYKEVFETYPFPVHDPDYIRRTMASHIDYYFVSEGGEVIAAASSEKDLDRPTAEMTDFATLPQYRGQGLAGLLLNSMENDMRSQGIRIAYTIARAVSAGMNITFSRGGYSYGGTLINNTNISGGIESMNVWYKNLL